MNVTEIRVRRMPLAKVKIVEVIHLGSNLSISEAAENILRSSRRRGCRPNDNLSKIF